MIWGAPNSGFYAVVGQGQVNCQPRLVVHPQNVVAAPDPVEGSFRLTDRVLRCRTMVVGVPRPGHMVEFRASFARTFSGSMVEVGFIPICRTERATDIVWHHQTGLRTQVTKDPTWVAPGAADGLITAGPTASQILIDRIARMWAPWTPAGENPGPAPGRRPRHRRRADQQRRPRLGRLRVAAAGGSARARPKGTRPRPPLGKAFAASRERAQRVQAATSQSLGSRPRSIGQGAVLL